MASTSIITAIEARGGTLGVTRLLVTGAETAAITFNLCWLGTFIPFSSPTHAYISIFTTADANSVEGLTEGTLWSLLFGGLVGGMFALIYNATASFGRR